MNQDNKAIDMLNHHDDDAPKLSSALNVLTILSFIGCAIQLLSSLWSYFTAQTTYEGRDKLIEQMNSGNMPSWAKGLMGDPSHFEEMITKSYENRFPILLLSLVAVALCLIGALQMRKLKKQGFLFYIIGELLPFLVMYLFIGAFSFAGIGFYIGGGITILFILLYLLQRKNLVN